MLITLLEKHIKFHASFFGKILADESKSKSAGNPRKPKSPANTSVSTYAGNTLSNDKPKPKSHNGKGRARALCTYCDAPNNTIIKCADFIKLSQPQKSA